MQFALVKGKSDNNFPIDGSVDFDTLIGLELLDFESKVNEIHFARIELCYKIEL